MQKESQNLSPIKQRILQYVDGLHISKREFYALTGISRGTLESPTGITEDTLSKFFAIYKEVSPEWILTGNACPVPEWQEPLHHEVQGVPLIPVEAIAGFGVEECGGVRYEECERYCVPEFERSGIEFVIRVNGSSMYPKYSSGDVLACKRVKDILFFQWGKVYVIDSSQGVMVKRVYEHSDPGLIELVSDNRERYPPFTMPKSDIRSLSVVLGVIRME